MSTKRTSRHREDLTEAPDWLLKKKCPHREKYLAGKRIMPKGITGKEKFPDLMDDCFLAYNSARLREVCRLFTERMLATGCHPRHELVGRADPGRPGLLLHCPA